MHSTQKNSEYIQYHILGTIFFQKKACFIYLCADAFFQAYICTGEEEIVGYICECAGEDEIMVPEFEAGELRCYDNSHKATKQ